MQRLAERANVLLAGAWNFVFVGCPDAPNSGHLEA